MTIFIHTLSPRAGTQPCPHSPCIHPKPTVPRAASQHGQRVQMCPPQFGEQDGNFLLNLVEGAADGRDKGAEGQSPLPSWGRCKDRSYKCPPQSHKCSPPILNPKSSSWVCSRTGGWRGGCSLVAQLGLGMAWEPASPASTPS